MPFNYMKLPYLEHFGLVDEPFSTSPNPRYLYISGTHNLALDKIKWTVAAKRGLAFCFGSVGTGKTTIARTFAQNLEDEPDVSYVFITNPSFPTPNQLLRAIIQEFEVPQTSKNYLELLNIFKGFLLKQAVEEGRTLVLIIDEAQTLSAPLLELIRQLMNYESNDQKFLQVVLFAQEEFRGRIQHPRYKNLVSRAAMSSTLENLSLAETGSMLKHRWMIAGGKEFPFTQQAVERIYAFSNGIPRTQIVLADNALLATFIQGLRVVDDMIIDQVVEDRRLPDARLEPEEKPELTTKPDIKAHKAGASVRSGRRAVNAKR